MTEERRRRADLRRTETELSRFRLRDAAVAQLRLMTALIYGKIRAWVPLKR